MSGPRLDRRRFLTLLAATLATRQSSGNTPRSPEAARAFRSSFEPVVESYGPTRVRFNRPLPKGLAGRLYRCGPARLQRGLTAHKHWFDGDGMVQSFDLDGQQLVLRGAMVRTTRYIEEEASGRFEWPSYATARPEARPVLRPDDTITANTSVLPIGDELLALWEGGSAWRLDADTLQTLGRHVLSDDTVGLPFSAHPRTDTDGTVWNFGYSAGSGKLLIYQLDRSGQLVRTGVIESANTDSVHDFSTTEHYLVFTLLPLTEAGATSDTRTSVLDRLVWDEENDAIVLLVDKRSLQIAHRFSLDPFFAYHFGNAWEDGKTVRLEVARSLDFHDL